MQPGRGTASIAILASRIVTILTLWQGKARELATSFDVDAYLRLLRGVDVSGPLTHKR